MAEAAQEGELSAFYSWSGLQRLLPTHHPLFEEWDVELHYIISSTAQVNHDITFSRVFVFSCSNASSSEKSYEYLLAEQVIEFNVQMAFSGTLNSC